MGIQAMISSLKNNRAMRSKGKFKGYADDLQSTRIKLEFKKVSEEELERVKHKIKIKAKKEQLKRAIIFMSIVLVVIIGLYSALSSIF